MERNTTSQPNIKHTDKDFPELQPAHLHLLRNSAENKMNLEIKIADIEHEHQVTVVVLQ